jgi:hypothetical protein
VKAQHWWHPQHQHLTGHSLARCCCWGGDIIQQLPGSIQLLLQAALQLQQLLLGCSTGLA